MSMTDGKPDIAIAHEDAVNALRDELAQELPRNCQSCLRGMGVVMELCSDIRSGELKRPDAAAILRKGFAAHCSGGLALGDTLYCFLGDRTQAFPYNDPDGHQEEPADPIVEKFDLIAGE